jgi:hypothetical protein
MRCCAAGGFVPKFLPDGRVSLALISAAINEGLSEFFPPDYVPGLSIIAEPGRFFAGPSATLLVRAAVPPATSPVRRRPLLHKSVPWHCCYATHLLLAPRCERHAAPTP